MIPPKSNIHVVIFYREETLHRKQHLINDFLCFVTIFHAFSSSTAALIDKFKGFAFTQVAVLFH